jgi:NADH-quinone oxidoreductase subunit J
MDQIGFGIVAACLLVSALFVVSSKNLVHSVLWLALTLATTAALFALLSAPFLAGIQVLLYTGGVITLMLFGVMLTRRHDKVFIENEAARVRYLPAFVVGAALFGIVAGALHQTDGLPSAPSRVATTEDIGNSFLTEHLLSFEVLSILLLAAMIGAIVIARKLDFANEKSRMATIRGGKDTP